MKPVLLLILVGLQSLAYGQITFEEITSPPDFNIRAVRKSPVGEYFVQAVNDRESIYSSLDGQVWTKSTLPESHTLREIQFFSDGSPMLQGESSAHLIRRDGRWYTMRLDTFGEDVEATFIRDDTLFVYQHNTFAYSIDRGVTFFNIFTSGETIEGESFHLVKFQHHFVLYHADRFSDFLSVFNTSGTRVLFQSLDLNTSTTKFTYNACGQVLINSSSKFYLLKEEDLYFHSGATSAILPNYSDDSVLLSQQGHYYLRDYDKILRTTGCNFTWQLLIEDELIYSGGDLSINLQGDILLASYGRDYFVERASGSDQWVSLSPDINYALVGTIDESTHDEQAALSSNRFFHKELAETQWEPTDTIGGYTYQVQYSPDGDLYINRKSEILYSTDNGFTFSTIVLPAVGPLEKSYAMEVLGNDTLLIIEDFHGLCYFSVDNGLFWTQANVFFNTVVPQAKLVNEYIYLAELDYHSLVARINITTNEVETESLGGVFDWYVKGFVILDDGTIYFDGSEHLSFMPDGLHRYRFGEGYEYVGPLEESLYTYSLEASGTDVYAFRPDKYFVISGTDFEEFYYIGLPGTGDYSFILASNDHVYVVLDNHRIFRSTLPLSLPYVISGKVYHDTDESCTLDTVDTGLQFWQVKVEGENYLRIKNTDSKGNFDLRVPAGEHTLSTRPVNDNWDLCTDAYLINIDEDTTVATQDFQAIGLSDCAGLEIDFSTPLLRRCFENYYSIRVRNTGPEATEGTTLKLTLDPFFDFSSATIPFSLIEDSLITFDLGVMGVNDEIIFRIFFTLSCEAGLGIEHCLSGVLTDENICG
jgi:hypothetical protein